MMTIGLLKILECLAAHPTITVGAVTLYPTHAFMESMFESVLDRVRSFLVVDKNKSLPIAPSIVVAELRIYQATLIRLAPGLQLDTMVWEALH